MYSVTMNEQKRKFRWIFWLLLWIVFWCFLVERLGMYTCQIFAMPNTHCGLTNELHVLLNACTGDGASYVSPTIPRKDTRKVKVLCRFHNCLFDRSVDNRRKRDGKSRKSMTELPKCPKSINGMDGEWVLVWVCLCASACVLIVVDDHLIASVVFQCFRAYFLTFIFFLLVFLQQCPFLSFSVTRIHWCDFSIQNIKVMSSSFFFEISIRCNSQPKRANA